MNTFGGEDLNGPFVVNEDEERPPSKTSDLTSRARNAFIRKVYTVLSSKMHEI